MARAPAPRGSGHLSRRLLAPHRRSRWMTISHGKVETCQDDQLIVALPQPNILASALNNLGVSFVAEQRHEVLGLPGAVSGKLAADTIPGVRSAPDVLNDLLRPRPTPLAAGPQPSRSPKTS